MNLNKRRISLTMFCLLYICTCMKCYFCCWEFTHNCCAGRPKQQLWRPDSQRSLLVPDKADASGHVWCGQGPPPPNPMVVERFSQVISQLFQQVHQINAIMNWRSLSGRLCHIACPEQEQLMLGKKSPCLIIIECSAVKSEWQHSTVLSHEVVRLVFALCLQQNVVSKSRSSLSLCVCSALYGWEEL